MISLITRNSFEHHVMLRSICLQLNEDGHVLVKEGSLLKIFKFRTYSGNKKNVFIADDPFAFLVGLLFFWEVKKRIFWMLELGMFQKNIRGLKGVFRALLFGATSWISLALASKVIFPSNLRKEYICDLFDYLKIAKKSDVIFNVPKVSHDELGVSQRLQDKVKEIARDFEKIAVYAGAMQEGRDLDEIISDSKSMGLALILCGPKMSEQLAEKLRSYDHVFYLGNLNQSDLSHVYREVCVGYVNYSNYPLNTKYCAPVKIWEYMKNELYIFSNDNFAMRNEWSNLVDRFYGISGPASDEELQEDIFSRSPEGHSVRIKENMLSRVAAD